MEEEEGGNVEEEGGTPRTYTEYIQYRRVLIYYYTIPHRILSSKTASEYET